MYIHISNIYFVMHNFVRMTILLPIFFCKVGLFRVSFLLCKDNKWGRAFLWSLLLWWDLRRFGIWLFNVLIYIMLSNALILWCGSYLTIFTKKIFVSWKVFLYDSLYTPSPQVLPSSVLSCPPSSWVTHRYHSNFLNELWSYLCILLLNIWFVGKLYANILVTQ